MVFPFGSVKDFSIQLSDEVELFRKQVRQFVDNELMPKTVEIEKKGYIPEDLIQKGIEMGFTGVGIPEEYDGQGGGALETAILMEELSRAVPAYGTALLVAGLFTYPVLKFGTEEQKRKYIPPIARGEAFGAHANTEPAAGSDVAGIEAKAEKKGDKWVINGRKIFITGADKAQYFIVSARTNPPPDKRKRWWGITVFIVERDWPGVEVGSKFDVMGLTGEHPSEVILNNVEVPEENIIPPKDEGFKILLDTYDHSRIGVASQAVGIAQGAFEKAFNYALQRMAFGRQIIAFEAVSFKLADMLTELQAARLLTYWAATLADNNREEAVFASSMAKTYATEVAEKVANMAIKIHGGVGVDKETGVEHYLRDAIITTIYEGTNDIQRLTTIRQLIKKTLGIDVLMR
jgi:alkylation response protein AidB-like acyl-CoA dehydrogenase